MDSVTMESAENLPAIISRASQRLAEAKTSGEVLEARAAAQAALHYAKLRQATSETQADCLRIMIRAEIRLAEETTAAQDRGEVARPGGDRQSIPRSAGNGPAALPEIGVTSQRLSEWRQLSEAGAEAVEGYVNTVVAEEDRIPSRREIQDFAKGATGRLAVTGEEEWYTPRHVIEAARATMGSIDTDPASCEEANRVVRAAVYFSKRENGLSRQWSGNVFLNPPYGREVSAFVDRLLDELDCGSVTNAILVVNNATDTAWFHRAARQATCVCFTYGRLKFERNGVPVGSPPQGTAIMCFGDCGDAFESAFSEVGYFMRVCC